MDSVKSLLRQNKTYSEIRKLTGLSKATISYHAKRMGMPRQRQKNHDWVNINHDIQNGMLLTVVLKKYKIAYVVLKNAQKNGIVGYCLPKGLKKRSNEELFTENSEYSRKSVKQRILEEQLIEYKCGICQLQPKWNNKPLVFVLDHINGINNDHRINNLRFLCPNCNSQTETFSGKNIRYKKLCKVS